MRKQNNDIHGKVVFFKSILKHKGVHSLNVSRVYKLLRCATSPLTNSKNTLEVFKKNLKKEMIFIDKLN